MTQYAKGTKVRIINNLKLAKENNVGHGGWTKIMDKNIGKEGTVVYGSHGDHFISFDDDSYGYTYANTNFTLVEDDEKPKAPKAAPKKVDRYRVGQIFTVSNEETSPTLVMLVSAFGSIYLLCINTGNWWSNKKIDINLSVTQKEIDYLKGDENNTIGISFASFKDMQAGVPAVYTGNKRIVHYTEMYPVNYESEKAYFSKEEFLKDHPNATFIEFVD
jgi:hypothetical protein